MSGIVIRLLLAVSACQAGLGSWRLDDKEGYGPDHTGLLYLRSSCRR